MVQVDRESAVGSTDLFEAWLARKAGSIGEAPRPTSSIVLTGGG